MSVLRGVSLLVVILLVVSSAGLAAPGHPSTAQPGLSEPTLIAQTTTNTSTPTNASTSSPQNSSSNSTARHIGPDLPQTDTEYDVVLSQFETRLATRLTASSDRLAVRDFEGAEVQLAGNTTELLRQYQRVAADSPGSEDDITAENFNLTVQQQRDIIDSVRNARATYDQYQLAQARGNQTRARQLARELLNESAAGNQTASELIKRYERLENTTETNFSTTISQIKKAQSEVEELERVVREENFITPTLTVTDIPARASPTALAVTDIPARASPTAPLVVNGRLTANTTNITNSTIALTVGDQTTRTQTNATGNFTVSLRPTTLATGPQPAQIRYVPNPTSPYEPTRTRFNVTIDSATPTVTTQLAQSRVQFGDSVTLNGHVTANQTNLSEIAVQARLNGQPLAQTRTTSDGSFDLSAPLGALIPPGTQQLTLIVSNDGAAVEQVRETRKLTVASTPTKLQLRVQQLNGTTLRLTGTLTTAGGTPLSDRRVSLTPGDANTLTIQTDRAGKFNTIVPVPGSAVRGGIPFTARDLPVEGTFSGSGVNLASATTTTTISYTPPAAQSARNILLGTFAVAVALGGAVFWQRRDRDLFQSPASTTDATVTAETTSDDPRTGPAAEALLDQADSTVETGDPAAAVRLGYVALRHRYVAEYSLSPALTHRELTHELRTTLPESEQKTLSQATDAYERVVYTTGAEPVTGDDARSLLDDIRQLVTDST